MDRGSILHSEKGPGVTFAIFLTFLTGGPFSTGVRTEHHGARNRVSEIVINSFSGDVCGIFI